MTVVGDVARVIDCEHKTAPRSTADVYGYSIGTRDVRNGRISLASAKPVTRSTFEDWTRRAVPTPGDIILSREAPMGEVGLVPPEAPVCLGQRTVLLQVDQARIEPKFLKYSIMAPAQQHWIQENSLGTTVLHLNVADVREIPIPYLPPVGEQQRIVDLLEDHLSRLDAADAYLDAARRRDGVLHDQLLASELASVPFAEVPLRALLIGGLANGRSVPTLDGGFPVLRLTALRDGRIDLAERKPGAWTAKEANRFLVQRGDFLISRGNGSLRLVGRGGLVVDDPDPVAYPDTLICARPAVGKIAPEFLALVWNAPIVRRQIESAAKTTAGIYKVNQKDLGAISVPVPSLVDQHRVVDAVAASRDALSRLSTEVTAASIRAATLRRSLLAAAFSGHLTGLPKD